MKRLIGFIILPFLPFIVLLSWIIILPGIAVHIFEEWINFCWKKEELVKMTVKKFICQTCLSLDKVWLMSEAEWIQHLDANPTHKQVVEDDNLPDYEET